MGDRVLVTGGSGFIGTTLIAELIADGNEVRSLDIATPTLPEHVDNWIRGDVLNIEAVKALLATFQPRYLVHLAAETEIGAPSGNVVDAYPVNSRSGSLLAAVLRESSVQKCVVVSTQYVCGPNEGMPKDPEHTFPHTQYGESKVLLEQQTRLEMKTPWVIVRPTYIWGPHNRKNFLQLLEAVASGRYLHPGRPAVMRSYGYVRTVSWVIRQSLTNSVPSGSTIYATDPPEDSAKFIERLSTALSVRQLRRVPRLALRVLASVGDLIPKFPMNSFRYFNMTTDYPVPYAWTVKHIGESPIDLDIASNETAAWYAVTHRRQVIPAA